MWVGRSGKALTIVHKKVASTFAVYVAHAFVQSSFVSEGGLIVSKISSRVLDEYVSSGEGEATNAAIVWS